MAEDKLIRSMTLAVAVAKFSGGDVSQFLLDRAEVEDNPVRRTVLNVMADKRFLDTAKPVMMWQEDASNELEAFADRLESERAAGRLTEERMNKLIEEFFSLWLALMERRRRIYESSQKARKKARMDLEGNLSTKVNIPEGDGAMMKGVKREWVQICLDFRTSWKKMMMKMTILWALAPVTRRWSNREGRIFTFAASPNP